MEGSPNTEFAGPLQRAARPCAERGNSEGTPREPRPEARAGQADAETQSRAQLSGPCRRRWLLAWVLGYEHAAPRSARAAERLGVEPPGRAAERAQLSTTVFSGAT